MLSSSSLSPPGEYRKLYMLKEGMLGGMVGDWYMSDTGGTV